MLILSVYLQNSSTDKRETSKYYEIAFYVSIKNSVGPEKLSILTTFIIPQKNYH